MQKLYERINWENEPSILTPLNAVNLNKIDYAVDELDNRVVSLDSEKADQGDLLLSIKGITYDKQTGIFTFTWHNGTTMQVDLNIEKIPVSFSMNEEGIITMATTDGTEYTCDVASLIKAYIFDDSDQIDFSVTTAEDGSYHVTGIIKGGSITEDMLESGMLGRINAAKGYAETAITKSTESAASAEAASASAQSASESAENAGTSATAASESATASQASAEAAEQSASNAATSASNAGSAKTEAQKFAENASGSASSASKSATSASGSAGTATTKASEAATSAANAKDSETKAKASEVKAGEYAEQAKTFTPAGYDELVGEVGEIKEDIANVVQATVSDFNAIRKQIGDKDRKVSNLSKLANGVYFTEESDESVAYSKNVPSGAMPYASLDKYGGKSIVWNQIANMNTFFASNGITLTNNGDGSVNISGTCDSKFSYNQFKVTANYIDFKRDGRKYLVRKNKSTSAKWGVSGYGFATKGDKNSFIFTNTAGSVWLGFIAFEVKIGDTLDVTNLRVNIFDLTQMFGAGNEPTVEEFEAMFPNEYYPYNEGEVIHADVNSVNVVGRNLFNASVSKVVVEGLTYSINSSEVKINGTTTKTSSYIFTNDKFPQNLSGKTCTISFEASKVLNKLCFGYFDKNGVAYNMFSNGVYFVNKQKGSFTFVIPEEVDKWRIWLGYTEGEVFDNETIKIMVEESPVATSYSPYHEESMEIPQAIQDIEGYGIEGNVVDFENKKFIKNNYVDGLEIKQLAEPIITDISEMIGDFAYPFEVESGGTITFHQTDDTKHLPVPSKITYNVDVKGAVLNE